VNWFVWRIAPTRKGWAEGVNTEGWTTQQTVDVFFGKPLREPLPHVEVTELSRGKLPEVLVGPTSTVFVNRRLHDILKETLGDRVQFLPAKIKGYESDEYWVANITATHAGLDRDKSDYEAYPKPPHAIHTVRKLVLSPAMRDAPPVFHLEEMPDTLIVREDVRDRIETESGSAGTFVPIHEYKRGLLTA
jgi:hypothetical protein